MLTVVSDFDGTLCFDGTSVADDIVQALVKIQREHQLIIASARPIRDLEPVLPPELRATCLVGGNGAFIREGGSGVEAIDTTHFAPDVRQALHEIIAEHELAVLIDGPWDYCYTGDGHDEVIAKVHREGTARNVEAHLLPTWTKVVLFTDSPEVIEALRLLPVVINVHSGESIVDIAPEGITKAAALRRLRIDRFVAFGNDQNDLPLFEDSEYSVCVGNHAVGNYASERVDPGEVAAALLRVSRRYDDSSHAPRTPH